ncbi:hypothetical protein ACRASX_11290 [Flavobacterium sp. TMP13]|uniref:hypothetical protein n=1 Tax=Flavobacterium sp. TMP13 TaxID=3425950 RepID=UPI003D76C781
MEIILIIVQILILVAIVIAYFMIKNLLPSYFSEKGKNIATKEDITEKVKTVESSISILTGNIVDYNSLKRNYILDYFGAYNNWQRTISNNEVDYSSNAKEINKQRLERILEAKRLYNIKEGEIELFISDQEFYQARTDLTIETLKFQQLFEELSLEIEHINQKNETNKLDVISEKLTQYRKDTISYTKSTQKFRNILISYLEKELKKMMEK